MAAILNDVMVPIIAIPLNAYSCHLEGLIPQYYIVVFIRYYIKYGKKRQTKQKTSGKGQVPLLPGVTPGFKKCNILLIQKYSYLPFRKLAR